MRLLLSATVLACFAGLPASSEVSKSEPESISLPDNVETSIGTLKFIDGVPVSDTVEKVYDNIDRILDPAEGYLRKARGGSAVTLRSAD